MKKLPKSKTYEEFVEKFKPKKTTDDCCTPPTIYEIVKQWPATNTGLTPPKLCGHDAQKQAGKGIFGSGLLLCERAAAVRWELSDREKAIIQQLG